MLLNLTVIRFILGFFILISLATMANLPLGLDEAYYWYWAKHPDLSYLDHPPMIAWIIALSTALGGDQVFFVRLGGFLLLWLGMVCGFFTVRQLFPKASPALAWEYLLILNLTLLIPGATIIQTPDTPLFAFWMLALYFGARMLIHQDCLAWYGFGLAIGLGLLSKYTMILLIPGILLFLLISPEHRYWLTRKEPWLAAILALCIWMPVLIWNNQHDWISFRFQINNGFEIDQTPPWKSLIGYFGAQAVVISPLIWVIFIWYSLSYIGKNLRNSEYLYLTLTSWPIILFFAWTSLCGTQAEANWPAPAYFSGILLAWIVLRKQLEQYANYSCFINVIIGISLIFNLVLRSHLFYPWLPIPATEDRLREFSGWFNLGQQMRTAIDTHPHPAGWFVMGTKGTILAEALFYSHLNLIGFDPAHPERYLFLQDLNNNLRGKNALIITQDQSNVTKQFGKFFEHISYLGPYVHEYRGVPIAGYRAYLYLGNNFYGNWAKFKL